MKRIGVFAAVGVILAVVIITGSSLIIPAMSGEKRQTLEVTSPSGTEDEVQIVITNEGVPETSPALSESGREEQTETEDQQTADQGTTAAAKQTTAASTAASTTAAAKPETRPSAESTKPAQSQVTTIDKTLYSTGSVRVRQSASTSSEVVGSLSKGQKVHAVGQTDNGWIQIEYSGQRAFVSGSHLSATKPAQTQPTQAKPQETRPQQTKPAGSASTEPAAPTTGSSETIAPFPG